MSLAGGILGDQKLAATARRACGVDSLEKRTVKRRRLALTGPCLTDEIKQSVWPEIVANGELSFRFTDRIPASIGESPSHRLLIVTRLEAIRAAGCDLEATPVKRQEVRKRRVDVLRHEIALGQRRDDRVEELVLG